MTLNVLNNFASRFANVPVGWKQRRMRAAVKTYQGEKNDDPNPTVLSLTKHGLKIKTDLAFGKSTENYVGHQLVSKRQFVFTPRDFDATPILCGVARDTGCISNLYIVFDVADEIHPEFLEYYLWGLKFGFEFFEKLSFGMRYSFNRTQFEQIPLLHPDLPTQKRIAAFLDRETARIDTLIAKKDAFADLILTREEASFRAAVTGKHAEGPKAPSGVDWIGDLPEGWSAPKFTMVAMQESGHTPSRKESAYWAPKDCVIPWVSLADVSKLRSGEVVYIEDSEEKISAIGLANSSARLLPKDTVVLSRTASVGFAGILAQPMATTQDFAAWICGSSIRPKFLYYVLRGMKSEFRRLMMGSTHQTIYMPDIRAFRTPLPPLPEQDRIISELDASIGTYRKAHANIMESVTRLGEYRAALITAAVTGQIDVDSFTRTGTTSATLDRIEEEMQG